MKRAAIVTAVILCLTAARPARASGHLPLPDYFGPLAFLLLLVIVAAPADLGADIPAQSPGDGTQFVLGWSWQFPVPPFRNGELARSDHHLLGGFDYRPESESGHLRGRFGYRYTHARLIAGLTAAVGGGWSWSPEVGVKLAHSSEPDPPPIDPSLYLLARANVAADVGRFEGVTVLLGWSLF